MGTDRDRPPGLLLSLDILVVDDPAAPRPLDTAASALERLGWIGRPVVLAGHQLIGRRLPEAPEDRITWVRSTFDSPGLAVAAFDEPEPERAGAALDRRTVEAWTALRREWAARWLLTSRAASVGPARRAGLSVVRIGPRESGGRGAIERADREARDLLDAVSQLLAGDAFAPTETNG